VIELLQGLRIVEFTQVLAGPFAGAIFSDLGAEIIKVERPDGGDSGRVTGRAYLNGDSLMFQELNRGKKSVTIDFKTEEGRAAFAKLIATADIFFHNQRPDVVKAFKLDGETLCKAHPRLIYGQLSSFGHKGPMEMAPGFEAIVQAYSGLSSINGFPDKPPVRLGASVVDLGGGMWTVIGILAALHQREKTGKGCIINTSLLETALNWNAAWVNSYVNTGVEAKRMGTAFGNLVPYQTFDAADDAIVIAAGNDRLFAKLADALGHPEWITDVRYLSNRDRMDNRDEIIGKINDVLKTRPRAYWQEKFNAVGVPNSPVNSISQAANDPQTQALDIIRTVPGEAMKHVGLPMSFNGERPQHVGRAPTLGEHNDWLAALLASTK
jgi:crotonobetainyl-CoA:carnitine CoA-transferase CaiB-like acyl-CoA transferase